MAKKNNIETYAITFRVPMSVVHQLDELCMVTDQSRGQFLTECITTQYDQLQGNPKLLELLEQFKALKGTMEQFAKGSN